MVNNSIKHLIPPSGDNPSSRQRRIPNGPIYLLSDVKGIAKQNTYLMTNKCNDDVHKLAWSVDEVSDLVSQLTQHDYKNSEWCKMSIGAWKPCDAYTITRNEYFNTLRKSMPVQYYIKFAIGPKGNALLIISCHT
ncbi:MAG: type II toxin-antitoxin system MqsR family toxin [Gammaproteobacteria bacterium]|nr:type II toxin-antitoxin system MqsR family toxin [Gammaproteobacteria bacterium]